MPSRGGLPCYGLLNRRAGLPPAWLRKHRVCPLLRLWQQVWAPATLVIVSAAWAVSRGTQLEKHVSKYYMHAHICTHICVCAHIPKYMHI